MPGILLPSWLIGTAGNLKQMVTELGFYRAMYLV